MVSTAQCSIKIYLQMRERSCRLVSHFTLEPQSTCHCGVHWQSVNNRLSTVLSRQFAKWYFFLLPPRAFELRESSEQKAGSEKIKNSINKPDNHAYMVENALFGQHSKPNSLHWGFSAGHFYIPNTAKNCWGIRNCCLKNGTCASG